MHWMLCLSETYIFDIENVIISVIQPIARAGRKAFAKGAMLSNPGGSRSKPRSEWRGSALGNQTTIFLDDANADKSIAMV